MTARHLTPQGLPAYLLLFLLSCLSCKIPATVFTSPDHFKNIRATVELNDNSFMTGYLSLNNVAANRKASIRLIKMGETLHLDMKEIKAYKTDFGIYELKLLHPYSNSLSPKKQKPFSAFVKRISQGNTLFNVYEYEERVSEVKSSLPKTVKHYYISLPGETGNGIWDVNGEVFSPDFNTKTRQLFNNDRSLVAKIDNKKNDYYYRSFSFRQTDKAKILLNLLNSYQNRK